MLNALIKFSIWLWIRVAVVAIVIWAIAFFAYFWWPTMLCIGGLLLIKKLFT